MLKRVHIVVQHNDASLGVALSRSWRSSTAEKPGLELAMTVAR